MNVAGKRVLITGGSSGIGLELAKVLLERRARLVVTGRRAVVLDSAVTTLLPAAKPTE